MIIFMGVAGSGKSVQGRQLADELGLPWLATGEFLRMLISGDRRKAMLDGKLLDDHEIITLVQKIFGMIDIKHEFVFDGFPRTIQQADWLLNQVKHKQLHLTAIIHIKATEEVVSSRLLARGRQDDHRDAIKKRFEEYENSIKPILSEMQDANIPVFEIDGEQSVQEVHESILKAVKSVA